MSSSSIALRLLNAPPISQVSGALAPKSAVAEKVAEPKYAQAFRAHYANVYKYVLNTFQMSFDTASKMGEAMRAVSDTVARARPQALSQFDSVDARQLAALGADGAIEVPGFELDRAAFDELAGRFVPQFYKGQPAFDEAWAAGKVTIQQASDVPEFNLGHKSFMLFKGDDMFGGAGWGKPFNQALYDKVTSTGVEQAFGGVLGAEWYVTWPSARAAPT